MMEKSDSRKCHSDIVLVASLDNVIIADRTAGFGYIFNARLLSALNIVAEGEECVRTKTNARILSEPSLLFLSSKYSRLSLEYLLPFTVAENVLIFVAHVNVDSVIAVSAADSVNEIKSHNLRRLSQPPVISFLTCKTCAVDS